MIDICEFSKWCVNRLPNQIVKTMKEYNDFINNNVSKFNCLNKIELVGDCCMVVGGLSQEQDRQTCVMSTVLFAVRILQNINTIRTIFNDTDIGVRIGIHVSDVFGVVFQNPRRFQLYGNDINVCSRLESKAIKNTINISLKTVLSNEKIYLENSDLYIVSPLEENEYKGVGNIASYTLHIKRNELLWFDTTLCSLKKVLYDFDKYTNHYVINNITKLFQKMKSFYWETVIIHCISKSVLNNIQTELLSFREWEKDRSNQNIIIVSNVIIDDVSLNDMCALVQSFKDVRKMIKMEHNLDVFHERRRSTVI